MSGVGGSVPTIVDGLSAPLVRREGWGATPASGWPPELTRLRAIVIHHTARDSEDADPLERMGRLQRFHSERRGWGDIGYSFVVLADGRVAEGRQGTATAPAPLSVVAGHAYGRNAGTLGIALAGRFHDRRPTDAAWAALVDLVSTVCRTCGLDPAGGAVRLADGSQLPAVISGHRDVGETDCPGDGLTALLPALRTAASQALSPVW